MARKSRKPAMKSIHTESASSVEASLEDVRTLLPTAAYGRLSVENAGYETDDSIQNQMEMVRQYIKDHQDLELVDTYIDNGFTGTNFNRPEFQRMMDDVKTGKIRCIVVKDLSRFGRDYLETGYYLETLLPHLNVRLISVTDDFDTFRRGDMDGIAMPIRNIVNSMYARDMSRKICSANEARRRRGGSVPNGTAPIGYSISEDRSKYIVDPESSVYIRTIFQWARMGLTGDAIAKRMNLMELPVPDDYRRLKTGKDSKNRKWAYSTIRVILKNPSYAGDMCTGRLRAALYKSEGCHKTSRDEWTITENAHEPLVSRKDLKEIEGLVGEENCYSHRFKKYNVRTREEFHDQMPGLVYCKECGCLMNYMRIRNDYSLATESEIRKGLRGYKNGTSRIEYYICTPDLGKAKCGGHRISADLLKIIVMDQLSLQIGTMTDTRKLLYQATNLSGVKNPVLSATKKLEWIKAEISRAEKKMSRLYEDFVEGIVEYEDYKKIAEDYAKRKKQLEEECRKMEQEVVRKKLFLENLDGTIDSLKNEDTDNGFNEKLVAKAVERIDVSSSGNIEIRFTFQDVLDQIAELMKEADKS